MDKSPIMEMDSQMNEVLQNEMFYDIDLICCDGSISHNRLVVGLIFPNLKWCPTFQFPILQTILLPDFSTSEVSDMISTALNEDENVLDNVVFVPVDDEDLNETFEDGKENNASSEGFSNGHERDPPDYIQIQPEVPYFDDATEVDYPQDYEIADEDYSFEIENQCNICSTVCKTRRQLQNHLKTHEKFRSRDFPCLVCPKRFYWEKDVKRHTRDIHGIPSLLPKANTVKIKQETDQSIQIDHSSEKDMKVKLSGENKLEKYRKNQIWRAQNDRKPYKCQFCGKGFKTRSYVKTHENTIHQENRPLMYQCEKCPDKKFLHLVSLKNHNRTIHDCDDFYDINDDSNN